jgi:hypothetical protein
MADASIDTSKIRGAAIKAFSDVVEEFSEQCKKEIADPKWSWPRTTERQNGSTAGTTRDIVDTGKLLASQRVKIASLAADIDWGVQYSAIVHQGNGTTVPARPWTETALHSKDWAKRLEEKWSEYL